MRGSKIAAQIEYEQRQNEFWKKKAERMRCRIDSKMQCKECKYLEHCVNREVEEE